MATYDTPRSETITNLESSVGAFLAQQILAAIDSGQGGQSPGLTVTSDYVPGTPIPQGTDIVIVQPGASSGFDVPNGVGAVIFTGPTGVQVSLNAEGSTAVQLTEGTDVLALTALDGAAVAVNAGAGDDVVNGALNASNTIIGGLGDDVVTGGNKNDVFDVGQGSDTVDGGNGFDQAFVRGAASDYVQTLNDDGTISLTNKATGEVTKLSGVEFLTFENGGVLLNVSSETGFAAASLFEVVLGRSSDASGQQFFSQQSGEELVASANAMLTSQEFTAKFGDVNQMSDQQFLDVIYQSAFERGGDVAGINFWLSKLAGGMSKGEVALNLAYSAEAQATFEASIIINKKDDTLS